MKPTLVCSSSEILGHQTLPFIVPFKNWASALFIKLVILPIRECTLTSVSPLLETCIISCLMAAGCFHKASVLWTAHIACSCASELCCPGTDDKWKSRRHAETKQSLICEGSQLSCNPDSASAMGISMAEILSMDLWQTELREGDWFFCEWKRLKGETVIKYLVISLKKKRNGGS